MIPPTDLGLLLGVCDPLTLFHVHFVFSIVLHPRCTPHRHIISCYIYIFYVMNEFSKCFSWNNYRSSHNTHIVGHTIDSTIQFLILNRPNIVMCPPLYKPILYIWTEMLSHLGIILYILLFYSHLCSLFNHFVNIPPDNIHAYFVFFSCFGTYLSRFVCIFHPLFSDPPRVLPSSGQSNA